MYLRVPVFVSKIKPWILFSDLCAPELRVGPSGLIVLLYYCNARCIHLHYRFKFNMWTAKLILTKLVEYFSYFYLITYNGFVPRVREGNLAWYLSTFDYSSSFISIVLYMLRSLGTCCFTGVFDQNTGHSIIKRWAPFRFI